MEFNLRQLRPWQQFWPTTGRKNRRRTSPTTKSASMIAQTLEDRLLLTIDLVFDYTYDSTGFFSAQSRRDVLEAAASVFESRLTDDLTAITPGGTDTWNAVFNNPTTDIQVTVPNLTIAADTVIIYVGARNLPSGLGLGGPGGFNAVASPTFLSNLQTRGETGVDSNSTNDTDFSLWGGTISFDNAVTWNFSLNEPTTGQNDLYSVALHEIAHVLGFGTADSFANKVNGSNQFAGTETVAAFGGPVPMNSDGSHFAADTMGIIPGTTTQQESAMDPQLTTGTRKVLTDIDWASLDDMGWDLTVISGPTDYGDAPDATAGTGTGNYQTRAADQGPSHAIVSGLFIGTTPDGDDGTLQNSTATADDNLDGSDEGFVLSNALFAAEGQSAVIDVNVTNTVGDAILYGWIDFDADGVFEASERSAVAVPNGTVDGTVSLTFPASAIGTAGNTFARFRLSTDASASFPTGSASDGEVEDHAVTILTQAAAFDSLPLFGWTATTGATKYELEVTNLTTGEIVISQAELTTTTFRPPAALPAGVYSRRQRAFVGGAFQAYSVPQSFAILETAGTPFITDPGTSSVDSLPTIAWSPVLNATRYELWVNGNNKERAIHQTALTTTSFTPTNGLPADNYTAWVRAFNGSTAVASWSPAFSFTLASSGVSVLTEPIGSSTNNSPTFGWLPMNSLRYTLQVDNLSTGQTNVINEPNLTGTSYTLPSGLPAGNYVATITGLGSTRSAQVHFQVQDVSGQAQFTMVSGRSENPLPTFTWTRVSGATRYELWVDDITNGTSQIIHSSSLTDTVFKATKPLAPSNYRAWVRAFNGTTAVGTWSTAVDYVVRDSSAVPTVWAPIDETQNAAPTFAWSLVTGATHYEFDIVDAAANVIQTQQFIPTNSLTLKDALPLGTYVTTVRAYNGASLLGTDTRRFYLTNSAASTQMFGPLNTINETRPTFSWAGVDNATRYILWVNDDTRGTNRAILQSNLQTTAFTPDTPLLPGVYRAWVRAYNGATPVSSWTFANRFTVEAVTGVPEITAPVPNTTNSIPAITWTSVIGAASYDIEFDNLGSGQNNFITAQGIATIVYRPTVAFLPGRYHVRVRSVDGTGTPSAWSSNFQLTIESANSATLVAPLQNSTTPSANVLFAWTTVTTASRYELWVNNLTTGEIQAIHDTNVSGISFTPSTALPAGNYRAWVRSIAADSTPGSWSVGVDFSVADAAAESRLLDLDQLLTVQALGVVADEEVLSEAKPVVIEGQPEVAPRALPDLSIAVTSTPESVPHLTTKDEFSEISPIAIDEVLAEFAQQAI